MNNEKEFNDILKRYKQRLVSLDSRNSSFFLSILRPKKHIDIVDVAKRTNHCGDIVKNIIEGGTIVFEKPKLSFNKINEALLVYNENNENTIKNAIPMISNEDIARIELFFADNPTRKQLSAFATDLFNKYDKEAQSLIMQFNHLKKQVNQQFRDFAKTDLYIGYPFVEGRFPGDINISKDFRGPLILHRVELSAENDRVVISVSPDKKIINPVFLLSFIYQGNYQHRKFEYEIEPKLSEDCVNYTINYLKEQGINLNVVGGDLQTIESLTKKKYKEKYQNPGNLFNLKEYAVVGLFPVSSRNIYNDIDALSNNSNLANSSLTNFLFGVSNQLLQDEVAPQESDIKYVTDADYSQRIIIKKALEDNLVIQGPPGTGKSQTIVNIIANLLERGKKVLVVSEKVAAIKVVYERLGKLRDNSLIILDHVNEKDDFYQQIVNYKLMTEPNHIYRHEIDDFIGDFTHNLKILNSKLFLDKYTIDDVLVFADIRHQINELNNLLGTSLELPLEYSSVHEYVNDLLKTENIELFKSYQTLLKDPRIKKHSLDIIAFVLLQSSYNYPKQYIQYNYYLKTNNLPIIEFQNVNKYKPFTARQYSYGGVRKHAELLIDKLGQYNNTIFKSFGTHFEMFGGSRYMIQLLANWEKLNPEEKKLEIKTHFNPAYKRKFFDKLFKRPIVLNGDEQYLFEYLNTTVEDVVADDLLQYARNIMDDDLKLIYNLVDSQDLNLNNAISLVLSSCEKPFIDAKFDEIYHEFVATDSPIDIDSIAKFNRFSKQDLILIDYFVNNDISVDCYVKLLKGMLVGLNNIDEAIQVRDYFGDENIFNNIPNLMIEKQDVSANYILSLTQNRVYHDLVSNPEITKQFKNIQSQAANVRRKSIKNSFNAYKDALLAMFPVLLMSPEVVSTLFPLDEELFDYVIFDEASQIFIERAIPSINRAKKVIIAGDSKQLRPSSIFETRIAEGSELEDDNQLSIDQLSALDKESLLEMAESKYARQMLKYHYRSDHKELIEFSNAAFYDNNLIFASKKIADSWGLPIETVFVPDGVWSDNVNLNEAHRVVSLVEEILSKRENNETIGIITFNSKQSELIQELLNESINPQVLLELERVDDKSGEDESLFVKNIENVQGDERDIVVFSFTYAKNSDGRVNSIFGLLSQSGGENRLNVAVSRAKKKIFVVTSINSTELSNNSRNLGPQLLKKYLRFAELVSANNIDGKHVLLNSIHASSDYVDEKNDKFDSPFEKEVYDVLQKIVPNNITIQTQKNVGGYRIDIVLYNKITREYILGIECDGFQYHSKPDDVERDYYRQSYLESRGWKIYRIISTNWWKDQAYEVSKLKREILFILSMPSED